jgi:hypothetical protein
MVIERPRSAWFVVGIVVLSLAAVAGLSLLRTTAARSQSTPNDQLVGHALAAQLGLSGRDQETKAALAGGCEHFAEVVDQRGYCLDAVDYETATELWDLEVRITGHVPTETEIRLHQIEEELHQLGDSDDPADTARVRALIEERDKVLAASPSS